MKQAYRIAEVNYGHESDYFLADNDKEALLIMKDKAVSDYADLQLIGEMAVDEFGEYLKLYPYRYLVAESV